MSGVSIRLGAARDSGPRHWRLRPGEMLAFGGDSGLVDVAFVDLQLPGRIGWVICAPDHWSIENAGTDMPIVAENGDGGHDFVKVMPGWTLPVPFSVARVLVLAPDGVHSFLATTDSYRAGAAVLLDDGPPVVPRPALLDEAAKYFLVLVALCEPALRYGSTALIPTTAQMVRRLRGLRSCREMTEAAVQFHLNYLLTAKLWTHVRTYTSIHGSSPTRASHYRRAALVDLSLRFNLVRHAHLALLEQDWVRQALRA